MATLPESQLGPQQPDKQRVVVKNTFLELAGEKVMASSSVRRICSDPAMYTQEDDDGPRADNQEHEGATFHLAGLSDADTDPEGSEMSRDPAVLLGNKHQPSQACSACSAPWTASSLIEGLEIIRSTPDFNTLAAEAHHPSTHWKPPLGLPCSLSVDMRSTPCSIDDSTHLSEEQQLEHQQLYGQCFEDSGHGRSGLATRNSFPSPGGIRKGLPVGAPSSLVCAGNSRSDNKAKHLRSHWQLPMASVKDHDFPIGAGSKFPAMLAAGTICDNSADSTYPYESHASAGSSKERRWCPTNLEEGGDSQQSLGSDGISSCSNTSHDGRPAEHSSMCSSTSSRAQVESHQRASTRQPRKARKALQLRLRPQTPGLLPQSSSSKYPLWPTEGSGDLGLPCLGFSPPSASSGREHRSFVSPQEAAVGTSGASVTPAPATTLIIRNVPNNYTRRMLMDLLGKQGFAGLYNFLYLPIDFRTKASLGYAFVNMIDASIVDSFWKHFDGFTQWSLPSKKVCQVGWAGPHQGLQEHIERYRSSPIMHESVPDEFKPILLRDGIRQPFPSPLRPPRAPRMRQKDASAELELQRGPSKRSSAQVQKRTEESDIIHPESKSFESSESDRGPFLQHSQLQPQPQHQTRRKKGLVRL